jgi:acyl-CoA thioesterase FadM
MARLKIILPSSFIFSCSIPVRITDINYGNHTGNDALVSIIHESRMQWLKKHGLTELKIEGETGMIMADLCVEFKAESFYGDVIDVKIAVDNISTVSFELYYLLFCRRNDKDLVLAHAKTGMVCYDYERKKVASVPQRLLTALGH